MSVLGGARWSREVRAASLAPLALAAGVIHLSAAVEHRTESGMVAGALLALSVVQIGVGWALSRRPTAALVIASGVGSLAVVAAWAASRTVTVPFVEGTPEAIGLPDLVATGLGVALAAGAVAVVRRPSSGRYLPLIWGLAAGLVAMSLAGTPIRYPEHAVAHAEHGGAHLALHVGAIVGASAAFACVLAREIVAGRLLIGLAIRER
jgi:hypothetical protein